LLFLVFAAACVDGGATTSVPTTTPSPTTTPTTTTEVIPPESGLYIVDPEEYPNGIPFSVADFDIAAGSQLAGVGFNLPEGSEIRAPFDGLLETHVTVFIAGQALRGAVLHTVGDGLFMEVIGAAFTFVEDGPVRRGDVIAVITSPQTTMNVTGWAINTLITLDTFDADTFDRVGYVTDGRVLRQYFSSLP
jgi:hypothetical protein